MFGTDMKKTKMLNRLQKELTNLTRLHNCRPKTDKGTGRRRGKDEGWLRLWYQSINLHVKY